MEHLRNLVNLFKEAHPELRANEELFQHIETVLLPHLLRVVKRDDTLFQEIELFPGIKVAWKPSDDNWKKVQMALVYSFLHGNPKEKFAKIMEAMKGAIPGTAAQADEVQSILEDEETQSSMSEMLELIMSTRLVSLVGDIIQSVDLDGLDIDFEDPERLLQMLRNPQQSELLNEIMMRARAVLEEKIRSGKLNQNELRRDIEKIRAKFQSSFGKFLNQAVLGEDTGNTTGNTAQQILSNHPDARRARIMARLQRKHEQKTRGSK
jgi:hypothetical protein